MSKVKVRHHTQHTDASDIKDGEWGIVLGRMLFRPPGTPRALPLSPAHKIRFNEAFMGSVTVEPSIHYDPGGPHEWHGWLINSEWKEA